MTKIINYINIPHPPMFHGPGIRRYHLKKITSNKIIPIIPFKTIEHGFQDNSSIRSLKSRKTKKKSRKLKIKL